MSLIVHLPLTLLVCLIILAAAIVLLADYLALKLLGFLKSSRRNVIKFLSIELLLTLLLSVVTFHWHIPGWLNLLLILANVYVWVMLLKHYLPSGFKVSKAIFSYVLSYVFISVFSIILAAIVISRVVQSYQINGNSLAPAYKNGDRVLVYKFNKRPALNEAVVYINSNNQQTAGRIEGTPGELIGKPLANTGADGDAKYRLGANQYFLVPGGIINSSSIVGTIGIKL